MNALSIERPLSITPAARLLSMRHALVVCAITGTAGLAHGSVSDNWRVVSWPQPVVESYLRDYVEGSGVTTNRRPFTINGNFFDGRVHDIDFDSAGNLYATSTFNDNGVYRVIEATGAMTRIATVPGLPEGDMGYDPANNRLVVVSTLFGTASATAINLSNMQVTTLWTTTGYDNLDGIAFDSQGNGFVAGNLANGSGVVSLLQFTNSGLNSLGPLNGGAFGVGATMGMDFNANDQLHILSSGGALYHVDTALLTANFVDVAPNGDGHHYTGLAFVPSPGTLGLLSAAGLVALRRRR